MRFNKIYFGISLILLIISVISLTLWKLDPSIDFVGGSLLEIRFESGTNEISTETLKSQAESVENVYVNSVQVVENGTSYVIRLSTISEGQKNEVLQKISEIYSNPVDLRFETVGPNLGKELLIKTGVAILLAWVFVMSYISYRFKDRIYGISAILAALHDSIILLGAFSLLGRFLEVEVDILFVTALLTTVSFSVHDTIVVFDRIREKTEKTFEKDLNTMINNSITETLPRSLNNSFTIIFMLLALVLLGGVTVKWFVLALLIGTVVGTYSSTFVAAPLLSLLSKKLKK